MTQPEQSVAQVREQTMLSELPFLFPDGKRDAGWVDGILQASWSDHVTFDNRLAECSPTSMMNVIR